MTMHNASPNDWNPAAGRRSLTTKPSAYVRSTGIAGLLAATVLFAACGSTATTPAVDGTMAMQLTDAPFATDSVKSVDVFVVRVDARNSDADSTAAAKGAPDDSASSDGWVTIARPNESVNLLAYQGGVVLAIGQTTVPPGTYLGFRLVIDATRSSVTLKNGTVLSATSTPSITFPSAARSGIKIVLAQPVTISANATTTVLVDFMLLNSFVMRGNSISQNGLLFTPVVHASVR
jgi:hypothetical protein